MSKITLDFFENCILKENPQYKEYYLLNRKHFSYPISLSHISIFDKEENAYDKNKNDLEPNSQSTLSKDKSTVNSVLEILMDQNRSIENKKLFLFGQNYGGPEQNITEKKWQISVKNTINLSSFQQIENNMIPTHPLTFLQSCSDNSAIQSQMIQDSKLNSQNPSSDLKPPFKNTLKPSHQNFNPNSEYSKQSPHEPQEASQITKSLSVTSITPLLSPRESRSIGSFLGMAIGDAMGARFEFQSVQYNKIELNDMGTGPGGHFELQPGQWTDDTSMGLCLADSLIVNRGIWDPHDLMRRFLAWVMTGYNNSFRFNKEHNLQDRHSIGLGGNISMALFSYPKTLEPYTKKGDKNTSGNGSIMRNAAVPVCFWDNIEYACDIARKQSRTTHQGNEAKECCALLTYIIVQLLEGKDLKKVLESIGTNFKTDVKSVHYLADSKMENNDLDRNWDWKSDDFKYSPTRSKKNPGYIGSYCMDNLSMSLHIVYHTNNFRDAIIKAANLRGDSDSVASVVGQIAGAYYPIEEIPADWIKKIFMWDKGEIALRGYILSRMIEEKSVY